MADRTEKLKGDVVAEELLRQRIKRLERMIGDSRVVTYGKPLIAKTEGDLYEKIAGRRSKVLDG